MAAGRCSGCAAPRRAAACRAQGLRVWDDPHNVDPRFTRVRLRHEVLPLLEDVLAGGVAEALARTAAQLRDDGEALDAVARDLLGRARRTETRRRRTDAQSRWEGSTPPCSPTPPLRSGDGSCVPGWARAASPGSPTPTCARPTTSSAAGADRARPSLPRRLELVRERGRLRVRRGVAGRSTSPARRPEDRRAATEPGGRSVYDGDIASVLITDDAIRDKIAELADGDRRRLRATAGRTSRTCCSSASSRAR